MVTFLVVVAVLGIWLYVGCALITQGREYGTEQRLKRKCELAKLQRWYDEEYDDA